MSSSAMAKRVRHLVVTGAVIGGLAFGASQLLAGSNKKSDCPNPPYDGPCDAQGDCHDLCIVLYPLNGGIGYCDANDCCICAQR